MNRTAPTFTAILAGLLSLGVPSVAAACSKTPVSIQRWSETTVLFIGRATADTARTGPGDVDYEIVDGNSGGAGNRTIHGQWIDVELLSSVDRKLLPADVKRVILVPWSYWANCRPIPWSGTARWIMPGTRGIYHATLRSKSHWLKGVPVLDVFSPEFAPYTAGVRPGMRSIGPDTPLLGIDVLYDAVDYLPDPAAMKLDPIAASAPFLEWARTHRSTIEQQPLNDIVRMTISSLRAQQAERMGTGFEGTFRFVVSIAGERDHEFFLRSTGRGVQSWNLGRTDPANPPDDITRMNPINGLEILVTLASSLHGFSTTCSNRHRSKEAWIEIGLNPLTTPTGMQSWSGQIMWGVVNLALGKDSALAEFKSVWEGERASRFGAEGPSPDSRIFLGNADGVTSINDEYTLPNGRTVTLRGERVSKQVHTCPTMF